MNKRAMPGLLLFAALWPACGPLYAQQPGQPAAEEAQPETTSREVEISEDNYRRFMELKDQPVERALPINTSAVQSQAGLEKMQRLPEASQKHLREQLRELIVESGPWSPASPQGDYPFVPSDAALGDGALRQQEAEAWEELVGQYHEREAAIHAARQAGAGSSGQANGAAGQAGGTSGADGQEKQAGQTGQDGAQADGGDRGEAGGDSDPASATTAAKTARQASTPSTSQRQARTRYTPPDEGTEQSALEFLTGQRPTVNGDDSRAGGRMTLQELERVPGISVISEPEEPTGDEPAAEPDDDQD